MIGFFLICINSAFAEPTDVNKTANPSLFSFGVDLHAVSKNIAVGKYHNSLALFTLGHNDNQTYYRYQLSPGGNWSDWTNLGGQSKYVTAGNDKNGTLMVFSIGLDNTPYYKYQLAPGGNWSNWLDLGGHVKNISSANDINGSLVLFSTGLYDNSPYYKYQLAPGGNWSNWTSLGGQSKYVTAGNDKKGNLVVFSIGHNNDVPYYKYQLAPGGNWSNWTSLGGQSKYLSLAKDKVGTVVLLSIGLNDNTPYYKYQLSPGGNWSNWTSLGGQSKYITASNDESGNLFLFSLSPDNTIYYNYNLGPAKRWDLLLGIAKSNQIIVDQNEHGSIVLFMVSAKYNQVFYSELLQEPEPILKDSSLAASLVAKGLSFPTSMAFLDQSTILVLEKNEGTVRLIKNGVLQKEPVLRVPVNSIGERGLLGILVYRQIGPNNSSITNQSLIKVYLYYTESLTPGGPPIGNRVYQYTWNGTHLVDPKLILTLPAEFVDHNAGKIVTGKDRNLYTVIGDQNRSSNLQNIKSGKFLPDAGVVIRIKPDGSSPLDNPFVSGAKNESIKKYFGYGIRNSFGLAVDPVTGNLWETENGENGYDELNLVKPGFNGGWKKIMGPISRSNITEKDLVDYPGSKYRDPKFSWYKQIGVTDLEFLNSSKLGRLYQNNLFVGDFHNGNLYFFKLNKLRTAFDLSGFKGLKDRVADTGDEVKSILLGTRFGGITDISTGPDGYLYVLTFTGELYKIGPKLNLQGK